MNRIVLLFYLLVTAAFLVSPADAGFWDSTLDAIRGMAPGNGNQSEKAAGLSDKEIANGLHEALRVGVERAVNKASTPGGFLNNPAIHIPLPDRLRVIAGTLKRLGYEGQVELFERTMNSAAEKATLKALPIMSKAVQNMTFEDVKRLWKGPDTAATDYFRQKTRQPLEKEFLPVVHDAVQQVGVTRAYQSLVSHPAVKSLTSGTDIDLDNYITDKALSGLFALMAEEEKKIRRDPVARTTQILKKVFAQ